MNPASTGTDHNSPGLVTAIVLTFNEEKNVEHCLESIRSLRHKFVVDSGSTDRTVEICRLHGLEPVQHTYVNHASQWQWALSALPIKTPWVLALDADFIVTPELLSRLSDTLPTIGGDIAGIYVRHRYRFGWGEIRYGGTKQSWLRIIRHGRAEPDTGDLVDFRFVVDGKVVIWSEAVLEYNRNDDDISVWIGKQDKFALRLATEEELRRRRLHGWSGSPRLFGNTDERFAWLRDRWLWLPLFCRPFLYFVYRYILALGFLDGRAGFLYHALQGFWLRLLVDWKTVELRQLQLDDSQLVEFSRVMLRTRGGSVPQVAEMLKPGATSAARRDIAMERH